MRSRSVEAIGRQETHLSRWLAHRLSLIPGIRVYSDCGAEPCRGGVLSFVVENKDCEEFGQRLGTLGFAVRSGLHCAPLAHSTAGTFETGTIRASISAFNTKQELEQFTRAVAHCAS